MDCSLSVRDKRLNVQPSPGLEPTRRHRSEPETRPRSVFGHDGQRLMVAAAGLRSPMVNRKRREEAAIIIIILFRATRNKTTI